ASDRSIDSLRSFITTLEDPLQHATVLAITGPHELSVFVLTEPVHVENLRKLCTRALTDLQPVTEVVAHVVAAEGKHRHRIATQLANSAGCGCSRFAAGRRAKKGSVLPV